MTVRLYVAGVIILAICSAGCGQNDSPYELVSASGDLPEGKRQDVAAIWGSFDRLRKIKLGPWECYTPDEEPSALLLCGRDGRLIAVIENGDSLHVLVPTTSKNITLLDLEDKDNDGEMDVLAYDGLAEDGSIIRHVRDMNFDGLIDVESNFKSIQLRVRIDDTWHLVDSEGRDSDGKVIYRVNIDGRVRRIFPTEYPFRFEELNPNKGMQPDAPSPRG